MSYADFVSDYDGTVNDKTMALLAANGATEGTLYDRWRAFFDVLEIPAGAHGDRVRAFLLSYLDIVDEGQSTCDLWALVDGPYVPGGVTPPPELLTNADFSDGTTGWTSGNGGILTEESGVGKLTKGTASASFFYQAVPLEAGKTYRIQVGVVESFYISSIRLSSVGPAQLDILNSGATGPRSFSYDHTTVDAITLYLSVVYSGTGIQIGDFARYDNFSVKEVV
jgi:hypothetical protein